MDGRITRHPFRGRLTVGFPDETKGKRIEMFGANGSIGIRLSELAERFRRSLFGLPAVWVVALLLLSRLTLEIDERAQNEDLPSFLSTTVDSGRSLLSAIASGTITAASVVFSLTLVSVQLASSQFSPRTLRNFLGDRFQQNVIGLVLGTFAFSLAVLRDIRGPLSENGSPVIPQIGISVAVVLAVMSLFGLLASINRTARSLRVSTVADQIVGETLATIESRFPAGAEALASSPPDTIVGPSTDGVPSTDQPSASRVALITATQNGWVQQMRVEAMATSLPAGTNLGLRTTVGSYVTEGSVLAEVWPIPDVDDEMLDRVRSAFSFGRERTLQQDVAYGLLQLEDIALRAMSPGINDPNTAMAIIAQMGAVLAALLTCDLGGEIAEVEGRRVHRTLEPNHRDYVTGTLDKIRRSARDEPRVLTTMLRMLAEVRDHLTRHRNPIPEALEALEHAAALTVAEAELGDVLEVDRSTVRELAQQLGFASGA